MITVIAIGTITLAGRWDRFECLQRNSNITGYRVSYVRRGNDSDSETETVMGTTDRTYTVMGLMTSTEYFVMVAAMNSDGVTGPFSNPVLVQTLSKWDVCKIGTTNLNVDLWGPPVSEFSWAQSICCNGGTNQGSEGAGASDNNHTTAIPHSQSPLFS